MGRVKNMSEKNLVVEEVSLSEGEERGEVEGAAGEKHGGEEKAKGAKPDFNVVQPEVHADGGKHLVKVGAMWKNISKNGNEFYTLKIGRLKLLVFENKM